MYTASVITPRCANRSCTSCRMRRQSSLLMRRVNWLTDGSLRGRNRAP
jgi:hypothetical protein